MIMNRNNDHWSFNMYTDELNEHRRKEEQKICSKVVKTRPPNKHTTIPFNLLTYKTFIYFIYMYMTYTIYC